MAKKGQHKNDAFDQTKSPGPNKPGQSQEITTGTYKKRETYEAQAREHSGNTSDAVTQAAKNDWREERLDRPKNENPDERTRARESSVTSGRSGSKSNRS